MAHWQINAHIRKVSSRIRVFDLKMILHFKARDNCFDRIHGKKKIAQISIKGRNKMVNSAT